MTRGRRWWDEGSFLGEVALLFTIVTVGNSVMMVTGLDEPKTGPFAYVHLLGRFAIIVAAVGLFHLDELGRRLRNRRAPTQPAGGSDRPVVASVLGFFLSGRLEGAARVFTASVVVTSVAAVAVAEVRPVAGGIGLYRNLLLLAALLVPAMVVANRWWHRRSRARSPGSGPELPGPR